MLARGDEGERKVAGEVGPLQVFVVQDHLNVGNAARWRRPPRQNSQRPVPTAAYLPGR